MHRAIKIILIISAVVVAVTPLPRSVVERVYSRGLYPLIQPRLTGLSNATTFAWFDIAVMLGTGAILLMWIVRLRGMKRPRTLATVGNLLIDTGAIAAVTYCWFLAAWGLNYHREPLRAQLDFREDRISSEALRALALKNVERLNTLHPEAHRSPWPELRDVPQTLEPAFARAQREVGMPWVAATGRPKKSFLDFYFTRVSIDGMTDPFFLEALAIQSLLPFERHFTVAHEWSHLAGYADESEANFVGWLICMRGPAAAQYSAWLGLYGTVMNALPATDRDAITRQLGPGPRQDLRAIAERVRRQTLPMARRASNAMYDRFLKAHRVEAGIRSYSEVLRLLLGTRFADDGTVVLRK